jgi:hypothetical protein
MFRVFADDVERFRRIPACSIFNSLARRAVIAKHF